MNKDQSILIQITIDNIKFILYHKEDKKQEFTNEYNYRYEQNALPHANAYD